MWNLTDAALKMHFQLRKVRCLPEIGQKNSMISVYNLRICPRSVKYLHQNCWICDWACPISVKFLPPNCSEHLAPKCDMCPISVKFRSPKLFKTFRTLVWHVLDIGQISSTKLFGTFRTPVWHVPDIGQISSTKLFRPPVWHVPDIGQISYTKTVNKLKSSLCAQHF